MKEALLGAETKQTWTRTRNWSQQSAGLDASLIPGGFQIIRDDGGAGDIYGDFRNEASLSERPDTTDFLFQSSYNNIL